MTTPQDFDFDAAYRGEAGRLGRGVRAPWSLGEPQMSYVRWCRSTGLSTTSDQRASMATCPRVSPVCLALSSGPRPAAAGRCPVGSSRPTSADRNGRLGDVR